MPCVFISQMRFRDFAVLEELWRLAHHRFDFVEYCMVRKYKTIIWERLWELYIVNFFFYYRFPTCSYQHVVFWALARINKCICSLRCRPFV